MSVPPFEDNMLARFQKQREKKASGNKRQDDSLALRLETTEPNKDATTRASSTVTGIYQFEAMSWKNQKFNTLHDSYRATLRPRDGPGSHEAGSRSSSC